MKRILYIKLAFIGLLFLISCKKDDITNEMETPINTTTCLSGFGERPGTPAGVPFKLPYNIVVTSQMLGYDTTNLSHLHLGIGTIGAIFDLTNFNPFACSVTFPAGLIFLPDNDSSQIGMTVYPSKLRIPGNSTKRVLLNFFCMNHNKLANYVNFYTLDVVSNNNQVTMLINTVSNKSESILSHHTWGLQDILWNITNGPGLTQENLDMINSWE